MTDKVLIYTVTCEPYEWCNWSMANYLLAEAATYAHAEVLIVFNSSSKEWVAEQIEQWKAFQKEIPVWPEFHFIDAGIVLPKEDTVSRCRQKAVEFARQNDFAYLYSLDADCVPETGTLQVLLHTLNRHPRAGVVGAKYYKRIVDPLRGVARVIVAMFREDFGMEMTTKSKINPKYKLGIAGQNDEVLGVGFGATLMRREFFEKTDFPELVDKDGRNVYMYKGQAYETEDLVYCAMARDASGLNVLWTDLVNTKHLHKLENGDIEVFG